MDDAILIKLATVTIGNVDPQCLTRIARRQAGLFTRAQVLESGYSRYQCRTRLAREEWQVVLGNVLAFRGRVTTPTTIDRAAQLNMPGSVLVGPSAARVWDIPVSDASSYLLVGPHTGRTLPAVRFVYESVGLRDVRRCDGLLVTSRARTVADCLRVLPRPAAVDLLDRALLRDWVTIDDLAECAAAAFGRRRVQQLRDLLRDAGHGSRSATERLLANLLRGADIDGWRANATIADRGGVIGVGDAVFDHVKLILELDGWAFHSTPDRFQRDRSRQNRLVAAGWTVLRFTWRDLTERPEYVIATVTAMLQRLEAA